MAASFSSHRDAGGTLHLPSPSASIHHVHSASAINQLRRSLSKSPSKSSDFRFFSAANSSSGHLNANANGTSDRPAAACASPSKHPHPHSLQSLPPSQHPHPHPHPHHHHHRAPSFHHTLSHRQDDDNDNSVISSTTTRNPFVPVPVPVPRPVSSSLSPSRRARAQPQGKLFLVQSARIPAASTSSPLSAARSSSAKQPRYPHPHPSSTSAAGAGASHSPVAKNTTTTTTTTTTRTTTVAPPAVASAINPSSSSIFTPATSTRFTHPNPRHALRRTASLQLCRVRNALNTNARGSTSPSRRPRQQQLHQHQLRPVLNESKNQGNALPPPATDKHDSFCATKNMTPLFRTRTLNTNNPSAGKIDAPPPPLFASSSSSSSAVVPSPSPLPSKLPQSLHIDKRRRDPLAPASRSASHPFAITSSPLKRSDEAMNLDEDNVVDSPSPKRRSVEGPVSSQSSFTSSKNNLDFSVFDAENRNPDLEMTVSAGLLSTSAPTSRPSFRDIEPPFIFAVPQSPASSSIPKRSSSLRKSTLQQRQPEQPFSLFSPQLDTSAEDVDSDDSGVRTHTRERSRTCNDAPGDNDFSPSSPFFNANSTASPATMNPQHQRLQQLQTQQNTSSHPLSRTLTQSSSEESLLDDSPSHEPVRNSLEKARPILHFSKSLPAGSTRPNYDPSELQTRDTLQPPTAAAVVAAADASFATPINYRLVKPLPAAFMSTGLISKKNKNAEDVALSGTKNMPDTPCKRSIFPLLGASTSAAGPTSGNMIVAGSGNLANNAGNASVPRSATVAGGKHKTMNRSALGTNVLCASQSGTSESAGGHGTDNDEMNNTTTTTMTDSLEEMNDRSNNIIYSNNGNLTANISTTAGTTFKTTPHPGPFSKGLGIFGSSFVKSRMMRRSSSSGSIDGDPSQASPSAKYGFNHGKNTSLDAEFPPTPTKAFTPANDDHSATGTIGGGSSIFQTAHTSRFAKPSSSRRLLLQDGLAQSPQGRRSPFSTAGGGGVTTPSGLTCKFSSCSSPSSPTSGETVSDSEYETDDDLVLDLGLDDDEDGDTAMDGSPSLLGVHHRHLHHHGRSANQSHGLPFSFASSKRMSRPRFLHESTRSPSPKEKNFAFQLHKPLPSSPSQQSSLFQMIAGEQPAKHALHPTASPLYGRTSLFKQPASADQTAAQQEQPDFGSQSSTPHTPLDTHFPQESHRLSIFGQNGISATPVANAATATPAANGNSIFSKGFGGNVSSAGSTKSYFGDSFTTHTAAGFPATPTGPRESFVGSLGNGGAPGTVDINALKKASLRGNSHEKVDIDVCLTNRFKRVEIIGIGEFSQVFMVANDLDEDKNNETLSSATNGVTTTPDANAMTPFHSPSLPVTRNMVSTIGNNEKVWAVKKSKQPFSGARDRERRAKEVEALKALKGSAHLISYEDSWEDNGHLYIQTEYCEEGSLKDFLDVTGWKGRVDDFRIWKTLLELAEGLRHIHDSGYIHLDIKPANVLIAAGGTLKIADFGLATPWPAEHGIDGEGDREYIGPEILMGRYDKPADIFALGLIIFEAASNVELPDNGLAWQKLRNGDMSDVPTLSWRDDADCPTARDTRGMPVAEAFSFLPGATTFVRPGELAQPPEFMVKPAHGSSLDFVVRWMISPDPTDRPTARQILDTFGARWVARRRRAGATIYEGNWGPADVVDDEQQEQSGEDEEMIDV